METTTYRVKGMTCDGCVRTLTRALEAALPGADPALPQGLPDEQAPLRRDEDVRLADDLREGERVDDAATAEIEFHQ